MSNRIEDLEIYNLSGVFANKIWEIVIHGITLQKILLENNWFDPPTQSVLILPKVLADIITRKIKTSVTLAEVRLLKQKAG